MSDGVDPTRLMAVGTYVGNGTATRTIPLALSGQTPTLVLVAPATTATRVYRADGDTTGRNVVSGAVVTNSVTALGPDQITVGAALNPTGVTCDVWASTAGALAPLQ